MLQCIMNLSKYRAFLKVASTKSFSQAASQMHCTQSAASRMIFDLENLWGVKLFSRMKSGAVLTPEGEALLPLIERLVLAENDVQSAATAFAKLTRGTVRIATFASVATFWLPKAVKAFRTKYPQINFEILMGDFGEIDHWVKSGRVDFGFTSPDIEDGLESVLVKRDEMVLAMHESHPLSQLEVVPAKHLDKQSFFLLEKGRPGPVSLYLRRQHIAPLVELTTFEDYVIINMVRMGLGCGILPGVVLQRPVEQVCYKRLDPAAYRDILLIVREGGHLSLAAQEFLQCFARELDGKIEPSFHTNIEKYVQRRR